MAETLAENVAENLAENLAVDLDCLHPYCSRKEGLQGLAQEEGEAPEALIAHQEAVDHRQAASLASRLNSHLALQRDE